MSRILSTGGSASVHARIHPSGQTPFPSGQTPLWAVTPHGQTPPMGRHPSPSRRLLQRTVCILLECILVFYCTSSTPWTVPVPERLAFFVLFCSKVASYPSDKVQETHWGQALTGLSKMNETFKLTGSTHAG